MLIRLGIAQLFSFNFELLVLSYVSNPVPNEHLCPAVDEITKTQIKYNLFSRQIIKYTISEVLDVVSLELALAA